jgi:hypothetical protein
MTCLIYGVKEVFLVSLESDSDNLPSTPTKANPSVHPGPKLASCPTCNLPDVVRTFMTFLPARHLPKPWLSLAVPHGQLLTWDSCLMSLLHSVPSHSTIKSEGMSSPSVMTLQMPRMMSCLRLLLPFIQRVLLSAMMTVPTLHCILILSGFLFDPKPTPTHTRHR